MNNKTASATGVTALCRYRRSMSAILALEEYYLSEQSGNSTTNIAILVSNLIARVNLAHSNNFKNVFIVCEANSCADNVALICRRVKEILNILAKDLRLYFCHYNVRTHSRALRCNSKSIGSDKRLGFWLGQEKRSMVDVFIKEFEAGNILPSYSVYSYTNHNPVQLLLKQLRVILYDGKPRDKSQDDVAISCICAFTHLLQLTNQQFSHMYSQI